MIQDAIKAPETAQPKDREIIAGRRLRARFDPDSLSAPEKELLFYATDLSRQWEYSSPVLVLISHIPVHSDGSHLNATMSRTCSIRAIGDATSVLAAAKASYQGAGACFTLVQVVKHGYDAIALLISPYHDEVTIRGTNQIGSSN